MNYRRTRDTLATGQTVTVRPSGNSMTPRLKHRQEITIEPITPETEIDVGDIVFCKVHGQFFIHLVTARNQVDGTERYRISNNHGHVNGWAWRDQVYGRVRETVASAR